MENTEFDSPEFHQNHLAKMAPEGWSVNPKEFLRVRQWNMLMFQLALAKQTLSLLVERNPKLGSLENFSEQYALFSSFILAYAKCFTSVGADQKKLDANDVFKNDTHLRTLHDEILVLRNKLVAHNDDPAANGAVGKFHGYPLPNRTQPPDELNLPPAMLPNPTREIAKYEWCRER